MTVILLASEGIHPTWVAYVPEKDTKPLHRNNWKNHLLKWDWINQLDQMIWIDFVKYVKNKILLMEEIQLASWYGSLSHYLQGFIHVRWLAGFLPSTASLAFIVFIQTNSPLIGSLNKLIYSTKKKTPETRWKTHLKLVGGFNPFEKHLSKWIISANIEV